MSWVLTYRNAALSSRTRLSFPSCKRGISNFRIIVCARLSKDEFFGPVMVTHLYRGDREVQQRVGGLLVTYLELGRLFGNRDTVAVETTQGPHAYVNTTVAWSLDQSNSCRQLRVPFVPPKKRTQLVIPAASCLALKRTMASIRRPRAMLSSSGVGMQRPNHLPAGSTWRQRDSENTNAVQQAPRVIRPSIRAQQGSYNGFRNLL